MLQQYIFMKTTQEESKPNESKTLVTFYKISVLEYIFIFKILE